MVQRVATVAFEGIEARAVDVQVQVAPGLPAFKLVVRQWQMERASMPTTSKRGSQDQRAPAAMRPMPEQLARLRQTLDGEPPDGNQSVTG